MTTAGQAGSTKRGRGRPRTGVREAILAAAEELLIDEGVSRLSTSEVAKRAGTAESSIFYHFGDRIGLMHEIISVSAVLYRDISEEVNAQVGRNSLRENLVLLLDALESFFQRIIPIVAALQADARLRADYAKRSTELDDGPHRALALVVPYLAAEQAAGRVRTDTDLRAAALVLAGAALQHAQHRQLTGQPAQALPTFAEVVAFVAPLIESSPSRG